MAQFKPHQNYGYFTEYVNSILPQNLVYYNIKNQPFALYGLYNPKQLGYYRIPQEVAEKTNPGVAGLNRNPAGGRVRFITDSACIAVRCRFGAGSERSIMALQCSAGFDVYCTEGGREVYKGTVKPPIDMQCGYTNFVGLGKTKTREITLYLPIYNDMEEIEVGLIEGSTLTAPRSHYQNKLPVVFYGSSITQGASANRSGLTYESILSRRLNLNYLNLGFAGSAKAEDAIVDYMAALKMCCFVSDYDYNAPTPEHLQQTHEKMYLKIRAAHPNIPYIMLSRPTNNCNNYENKLRRGIIFKTWQNALNNGDQNAYFIDGFALFGNDSYGDCEGDGVHPSSIGFLQMANALEPVLRRALFNQNGEIAEVDSLLYL